MKGLWETERHDLGQHTALPSLAGEAGGGLWGRLACTEFQRLTEVAGPLREDTAIPADTLAAQPRTEGARLWSQGQKHTPSWSMTRTFI